MSYCRYENTLADLRDCKEAMSGNADAELSESERSCKKALIQLCIKIARDYGQNQDDDYLAAVRQQVEESNYRNGIADDHGVVD